MMDKHNIIIIIIIIIQSEISQYTEEARSSRPRNRSSFFSRRKYFSLLCSFPFGFGAHTVSCIVDTAVWFPEVKAAWA
jgi:hypothetical protein